MEILTKSSLPEIYSQIINMRRKYAELKKCEIHLHTPASYDYCLIKGRKYESVSLEELLEYALEIGYLSQTQIETLKNGISRGDFDGLNYIEHLNEKNIPYDDFKEYLTYMLIAHKLYILKVDVVVISDHNTISGFYKLKYALNEYFKERIKKKNKNNRKSIFLLLGIEITCSDKNHVVGIFDDRTFAIAEKFVDKYIYSEQDGTIETSLTIIREIMNLGGIGYIAHINSSDFLGTGLYKQNLFSNVSNILGSTNLNIMDRTMEEKIYPFVHNKDFCILHEGDSHDIESIGHRNSWVRLNEFRFSTFKKALIDYRFTVYTKKPKITNKFIKGIYIDPGETGFMGGKDGAIDDNFVVDFSKDLNCIIGGRGTGKSTLLNIIDTIFSRTSPNKEQLKFISDHKMIVIVFTFKGFDYVIKFIPQLDPDKEYYQRDFFLEKAFRESKFNNNGYLVLADHWVELYKVGNYFEQIVGEKKNEILNVVYRSRYSINNIIQKIDKGEIGEFIKEVIFDGIPSEELSLFLKELGKTNKNTVRSYLKDNLPNVSNILTLRKEEVAFTINQFNSDYKDLIQIEYGKDNGKRNHYIDELLFNIHRSKRIRETILNWEDVERYLYTIITKIDFITFFNLLIWQRFSELEKILPLSSFSKGNDNRTLRDIDRGYEEVTSVNLAKVYREVLKEIVGNRSNLTACFNRYFEITDNFNILFNVNSKETHPNQGILLKSIESLSLGQKVAAILTFIFKFGFFANDNTPLIIDQPEDNLDSQYIYKNLVSSLREIKNNRQVIIVTHNSTIVTNAAAEQVIVLNSNNEKAWLEQKGYQGNKGITKSILQYLEGGEESFLHKMETYTTILNLNTK